MTIISLKVPITYTISLQQCHLIFLSTKELTREATTYKLQNHSFHYGLRKHFFRTHCKYLELLT